MNEQMRVGLSDEGVRLGPGAILGFSGGCGGPIRPGGKGYFTVHSDLIGRISAPQRITA